MVFYPALQLQQPLPYLSHVIRPGIPQIEVSKTVVAATLGVIMTAGWTLALLVVATASSAATQPATTPPSSTTSTTPPPPPPPPPNIGPPPCPESCDCSQGPAEVRCFGHQQLTSMSFEFFGLTRVPQFLGFYPQLSTLNLNFNPIRVVDSQDFSSSKLPELETLSLANNLISTLEDNAFQLPGLEFLDLSNNDLRVFPTAAIRSTSSELIHLDLTGNDLDVIEDAFRLNPDRYPALIILLEGNNNINCFEAGFISVICAFIADEAMCFDSFIEATVLVQDVCAAGPYTGPTDGTTDLESTAETLPVSGDDSTAIIVGAVVGGVLGLGLLVLLLLLAVLLCYKLKMWERKIENATGYRNDTLSQQLRGDHRLSYPRYTQPPSAAAPYLSPLFSTFPAPPPYSLGSGTVKPGSKQAPAGDTDTLYEDMENFGRPLPDAPQDDVDYETGYILRVDTIPDHCRPAKTAAEEGAQRNGVSEQVEGEDEYVVADQQGDTYLPVVQP